MYTVQSVLTHGSENEYTVVCNGDRFLITRYDYEQLQVNEGDLIDDDAFEALCFASKRLTCIKKAFEYLSYGDLSQKQLYDKLIKKFPKELSQGVAELMTERGYVDDSRLAKRYAETFYEFKLMGLNRIRSELFRRGISKENIDLALEPYECEDQVPRVLEYLHKKYDVSKLNDYVYRRKVYGGLVRAGFGSEDISDALNSAESE